MTLSSILARAFHSSAARKADTLEEAFRQVPKHPGFRHSEEEAEWAWGLEGPRTVVCTHCAGGAAHGAGSAQGSAARRPARGPAACLLGSQVIGAPGPMRSASPADGAENVSDV